MLRPWYAVGAQYVDGLWQLEEGRLADYLTLLFRHGNEFERKSLLGRAIFKIRRAVFVHRQKYGVARSFENVERHYDLGDDLFESFLDSKLNYTCADFENGACTIDEAQDAKLHNTLARLDLQSGHRLLEIGCGWGSLSRLAATKYGAFVTALTLSRNQLKYSEKLAADISEPTRPRYLLEDYREHEKESTALYDRIVSVGMLEHVGYRQLETYFAEVKRLLKPDGVALVHTIARHQAGVTNPWLARNIFPGGYIAQLDEVLRAATVNGFVISDQTYRYAASNYICTLRHWAERFSRSWPIMLKYHYPERVRRTYEFYFAASEAAFRELDMHAVQFVFRKT
jgi:cyclopropane-fatty-acyl-phospholipid synthase